MIGKVDPETLHERVFGRTGAAAPSVLQGAAYGEDAAAIALEETVLVVSADPLSLAAESVGTLAIHVACNDVAASGADPRWLTNVLFLPDDDPDTLDTVTMQLDRAARDLGVAIVGGHSEYHQALARPLLSLTCFGTADRFIPSGGARPGDRVLLTKGAGIEGTAILASDFGEGLSDVSSSTIVAGESLLEEISVVPEARVLRAVATAMHDPTEGGVLTGLVELAHASGVGLDVEETAVPVRSVTRELCTAAGVDPLKIFGSGALIATVPDDELDAILDVLSAEGIRASVIGSVVEAEAPGVMIDDEWYEHAIRDEMYRLWEDAEQV